MFGRNQLMQFRWDLAVGDDTLTEDEIAGLAEAKAPLVRLRGQWVAVDPEQLRRGLDFLQRSPTGRKTAEASWAHTMKRRVALRAFGWAATTASVDHFIDPDEQARIAAAHNKVAFAGVAPVVRAGQGRIWRTCAQRSCPGGRCCVIAGSVTHMSSLCGTNQSWRVRAP